MAAPRRRTAPRLLGVTNVTASRPVDAVGEQQTGTMRPLPLVPVLLAGVLLSACGDDDSEAQGDARAPSADARAIEVVADDFAFEPSEITAEVGEELAVSLTSEDTDHDFTVEDLDFHVHADQGDTVTGGLQVDEPGTYTFYCSVPGHRGAGMEGTITVE